VLTCAEQINLTFPQIDLRSTRCLINADVDQALKKISRSGDVLILLLMLRAYDRSDQLDKSYLMIQGSFSWMSWTSKYFKLLNFLFLDSTTGLHGWFK
jgi:hypothetical protein